jgi:hypothetical protein
MATDKLPERKISGLNQGEYEECENVYDEAIYDFWQRVAKRFPAAVTGDLPPELANQLNIAAVEAICWWYRTNVKGQ